MIHLTTIQFPDIRLQTRDAHKLRGYFGNLFREHSPLLHNHYEDGSFRHRYPLVQYKVLEGVPTLVALNEGAELLNALFLNIKTIQIAEDTYEVNAKHIRHQPVETAYADTLHTYQFQTLWMALNQENHRKYVQQNTPHQQTMLNRIAVGNILSFFKAMNLFLEPHQRLMAQVNVAPKPTQFKNQRMTAFAGSLIVNALLPDHIGIGKAVSRGFGTIKRI